MPDPSLNPVAKTESFTKTPKTEGANANTYADLEGARQNIAACIEYVYKAGRLHSALGCKSPARLRSRKE